jgi:hypothetical protein
MYERMERNHGFTSGSEPNLNWPAGRPDRRILGIGALGRRLIVILIALVIATLVTDIAIGSIAVNDDIKSFIAKQQHYVVKSAALTAGTAFDHGNWDFEGLQAGRSRSSIRPAAGSYSQLTSAAFRPGVR